MIYTGRQLREISFPLGGIGTGSIGLAGNGRLTDFEIFNRPNKGSVNGFSHIAVRAVTHGKCVPRVLSGDYEGCFTGQTGYNFGYGVPSTTMAGFPHFRDVEFRGEFPYAFLRFGEGDFPSDVRLKAFSPFIPLSEDDSSLPVAVFEVNITNTLSERTRFAASFSFKNPYGKDGVNRAVSTAEAGGPGVCFESALPGDDTAYGNICLACDDQGAQVQTAWYRGGWNDSITTFWNEFSSGRALSARSYPDGKSDHATVMSEFDLDAGESRSVRFVLSWYNPNCYNYWSPLKDENGRDVTWKNHYATRFESARAVSGEVLRRMDELDGRTMAFHDALFASTVDPCVLDAAASSLSVLRSATVMRLEDGSFYGFEGESEHGGSCEGTCQHVWNYAYALPFLFPRLERSMRDLEYKYSTDEHGHMEFRLKLPLGRAFTPFRACVDGQMGAVIKTYREWKLSGDTEWLRSVFPKSMSALEYAVSPFNPDGWDADADGVLEGRQHHTLDMELFGPSAWLEGFYLLALDCGRAMAEALGYADKAALYKRLYESGRKFLNEELFNGEYFCQKIDLTDKALLTRYGAENYWNDEAGEIKYQIAGGSSIDQMCAQWHADILGLSRPFDKDKTDTALRNMMKYNFMPSVRYFANPWRLFCLNDESGTLICAYPEGTEKPKIPVPYCEETMHGFEYQFAGLLIAEGFLKDGLRVVKAVRDRYDGTLRNPYNEIECGSNYARSMAAWALLPILSGFSFDLVNGYIGFDPKTDGDFRCVWSLGTAWGSYARTQSKSVIEIAEGTLALACVGIKDTQKVKKFLLDGREIPFTARENALCFERQTAQKRIELVM